MDLPLCVDLDGTLCRTNTLIEMLLLMLRRKPRLLWALPGWLLSGRAELKAQLARRVGLDPAALCYNRTLLQRLAAARLQGRKIVLVTAAHERIACAVAEYLGGFDDIIASSDHKQVKGAAKLAAIRRRFGAQGFDYAGDSAADFSVWKEARTAIYAGYSRRLERKLLRRHPSVESVAAPRSSAWPRQLRIHQWSKNLIVFVPLLAAHDLRNSMAVFSAALIFLSFCLCASAAYMLNDLLDLHADRRHVDKQRRPFAAGDLPLGAGLLVAPVLALCGVAVAASISLLNAAVSAAYLLMVISYSFLLKRFALADIFMLAGLYTLRLIAGNVAAKLQFSPWLLAFSMFIFLSLAVLKRVTELNAEVASPVAGRDYARGDLDFLRPFGILSGGLAVLILALYVTSTAVTRLYRQPMWLLFLCPIFLYWIARTWLVAQRGQMPSDLVLFALTDKFSYFALACVITVVLAARPL